MDIPKQIQRNLEIYEQTRHNYPTLSKAGSPLSIPTSPIIGRDTTELRKTLRTPEKANAILLGEPGVGKTAFMQSFAYNDSSTSYLVISINVERIIEDNEGDKDAELANGLQNLVAEVADYCKTQNVIMVLFIDEFHRIPMLSPTAVEALKPILEKSASNGFRIVGATTFEEYDEHIAPNRALDQRMLRITMTELSRGPVISILKSKAELYKLTEYAEDDIYETIYNTSKEILISNSQPRASIDIFNAMIGTVTKDEYMKDGVLVREYATPSELGIQGDKILCRHILNDVIQRSYGIDIDNKVRVNDIRTALNARIYNQEIAVNKVMGHLEMILAGFNDPTRPKCSLLFTGPTGTGKMLGNETPVPTPNGWVKHGDLKVGDYVFSRLGEPTRVTSIHPHTNKRMYEVELVDGRKIEAGAEHLWKVYTTNDITNQTNGHVLDTQTLADSDKTFYIPKNKPVQYQHTTTYNPYLIGLLLGVGIFIAKPLTVVSDNDILVTKIAKELNALAHKKPGYRHVFMKQAKILSFDQILPQELQSVSHRAKYIPMELTQTTIEQRLQLIQGLFDACGDTNNDGSVTLRVQSERLRDDVAKILYSLGYYVTKSNKVDFELSVFGKTIELRKLFTLENKKANIRVVSKKDSDFEYIEILRFKRIPNQDAKCITVDNDEHLYLAGEYIVTHNTELTKVVAETMGLPFRRFDMSRYPSDEDARRFADDLSQAAWSSPNGLLLIDEIEKSGPAVINNLLQVLDDARLTAANNPNRVISFTGNIIFMTTNVAREVYKHMKQFDGDNPTNIDTDLIYKALADDEKFASEVLGRIDGIVPFLGLPEDALTRIVQRELDKNIDIITTDKRKVLVSDDIIPYIVIDRTSQDNERGGARDAKRNVKSIVLQEIAKYLADEPEEVPIIIHLVGEARFKYSDNSDPLNAHVALTECHPQWAVDSWMAHLRNKLKINLIDAGIYVPNTWSSEQFVQHIYPKIQRGIRKFKTYVDDDRFWIDQA